MTRLSRIRRQIVLCFLGDLFERGPDSQDVLRTVLELSEAFQDKFILLPGNHEDFLLQPKLTQRQRMTREAVGRQATVNSFRKAGENMEDALPYLKGHVRLYRKYEEKSIETNY